VDNSYVILNTEGSNNQDDDEKVAKLLEMDEVMVKEKKLKEQVKEKEKIEEERLKNKDEIKVVGTETDLEDQHKPKKPKTI
jgi:hypothetical protein